MFGTIKYIFQILYDKEVNDNKFPVPKKYRLSSWIEKIMTLGVMSFRRRMILARDERTERQCNMLPVRAIFATCNDDPFYPGYFYIFDKNKYSKGNVENGKWFGVCGFSLSCHGLDGYEFLQGTKVDKIDSLKPGEFIVIKIDPQLYDYDIIPFSYKVREYIISVDNTYDADGVVELLKNYLEYAQVFLPKPYKQLKKNYENARDKYPDDDLSLTVTYPNGYIYFDFCRTKDIKYTLNKFAKEPWGDYINYDEEA